MTVGRICIDSGAVGEVVGDMVIRDRRLISEDGIVLPIIAINKHTGKNRRHAGNRQPRLRAGKRCGIHAGARATWWRRRSKVRATRRRRTAGVVKEKIRADLKRYIHQTGGAAADDYAGDYGDLIWGAPAL